MRVIGTAGHVDHGKSTLVLALTGIDPDRLREEKEREMTIDLGFAWLALPPSRVEGAASGPEMVGVIDVPGHIDFIKNMLAGVGGIDAALFVVAADEGVMPQAREHLAILDLLQVPAGVVALTKTDAITEEGWIELVQADLAATLQGTCLEAAPIVPVSARTGADLPKLKQALADVLATVPQRRDKGVPRLPIDRIFTIAGFGTVVTGTLSDGQFRVGDEVEIMPTGLKARIRGMQTHKKAVETGLPGSRLAINLTGVHPDELSRGMVVARPGALRATTMIDVRLRLVRSHDWHASVGHSDQIDFFSGAAEVPARVRLLDAEEIPRGAGRVGATGARIAGGGRVRRPVHHSPAIAELDRWRRCHRQPLPRATLAALPGRGHCTTRDAGARHTPGSYSSCACSLGACSAESSSGWLRA